MAKHTGNNITLFIFKLEGKDIYFFHESSIKGEGSAWLDELYVGILITGSL